MTRSLGRNLLWVTVICALGQLLKDILGRIADFFHISGLERCPVIYEDILLKLRFPHEHAEILLRQLVISHAVG